MRFLDMVMPFWQKRDQQVTMSIIGFPRVVIVPVCYTATQTDLTIATRKILLRSMVWQQHIPSAYIAIGNYDILTDVERRMKERLLYEKSTDPASIIWTDPIQNSADEMRKISQALARLGITPEIVLVVTGPTHSRTARRVGEHEFPKSKVFVDYIEHWEDETQQDHMVRVQRSPILWFFMNVLRQCILCLPGGFEFIARRHHRVVKHIVTTA